MKLTLILALALPLMGQIVPTWADADGRATLGYCIAQPAPPDAERQIEAALKEWAKYVQIDFRRDMCYSDRTLTFSWVAAEHGCGVLGTLSADARSHAHWPAGASEEPIAGDVHFWVGREWTPTEIYIEALHEIGHALGLRHGRDPWGVMYDIASGALWLQRSDIEAVRRLYARRCFGVECAWGLNR